MHEFGYVVNVDCAVARETESGDADRTYLFVRRSEQESHAPGALAFPGGKLEAAPGDDEALERTARREVREETGVTVTDVRYVHSTVFETDDGTRVLEVVTTGTYAGGDARVGDPTEVAAVEWRDPAAIRSADDTPGYLRAQLDAVERVRWRRRSRPD